MKSFRPIAKAVAFSSLCIAAAWLEVSGKEADGLWVLLVAWVFLGEWD